jgi:PAS domain S-box-containing protein
VTQRRRALLLALPGLAAFVVAILLVALPHHAGAAPPAPLVISIGLAFWLSSIVARSRRPDSRMGLLLDVTGIFAFLVLLPVSHDAYLFTLGLALNSVVFAAMVHVLLAYPTGTLAPPDRKLVAIAYALAIGAPPLSMLFSADPARCGPECPRNVLYLTHSPGTESAVTHGAQIGAAVLLVAVAVVLVRRWRSASPAYRRTLRGVYGIGVVGIALLGLSFAVGAISQQLGGVVILGAVVAIGAVPVILLAGLLGPRRARGVVGRVVAELGPAPAPGHLRAVLRDTLHDPELEVGYWLPDLPGFVDIEGRPFDPADAPAATYVDGEEGRIGVLTHDAALRDADALEGLVSAVRLVLENERLHADLRSKLVEIQQQQSFTDLIVDNAPAFFCVVDADGRLRGGVNDPLLRLIGRSHHGEVADELFWDVFCVPEEVEETKARLAAVAAGRETGVQEALLPLPSGERRVVEWRDTVLPDEYGQLKWIVRAGLDVTERKRHEAELQESADEQSALRRVATVVAAQAPLDELVRTVTHEVAQLFRSDVAVVVRNEPPVVRVIDGWAAEGMPAVVPGETVDLAGGDTSLARALASGEPQRLDDPAWEPYELAGAIAAPIVVDGEVWGAIGAARLRGARRFEPGREHRLADMASLVAQALANAASRAELSASRVRIVRAADEARRKLERNLHDGAQQRLVSLSITLRLAESQIEKDPQGARAALHGASEELSAALSELRELARGIHPAILTDRGLVPALNALADRATLPVEVVSELNGPLPPAVEAAAYYVVSESLANVAKHANAGHAFVRVSREDGVAYVEVEDDGVGGADAGGSGLRGLVDRVEALDGRFGVGPGAERGTRVWAEIPCV